jgi:hypothetical protein
MSLTQVFIALAVAEAWVNIHGAVADDKAPRPLTPVEARKVVGEEVLVEFTVNAAKDRLEKRGEIFLDSELDFRNEKNFAAVINREGAAQFRHQGVMDFEEHFRNKTIRVKGRVTVVEEVPRIDVSDSQQIALVKTD